MYTVPDRIANEQGNPQVAEDAQKNDILNSIHCSTIGVVTAFDSSTTSVTVKPLINEKTINGAGTIQWVDFPELSDVPFITFSSTQPNPGDPCLLIFCDYDFSAWWNSSSTKWDGSPKTVNQEIIRPHSINNCVAIMGLHAKGVYTNQSYTGSEITASQTDNGTGVSEALIAFIKSWESFQSHAYHSQDWWNWTIGYGHVITPGDGLSSSSVLTEAQADALMRSDLTFFINGTKQEFSGVSLSQNQFDALVDIAWGCGNTIWSKAPKLTSDVKSQAAASVITSDMEAICHVGSTVSQGLLRRRDADAEMYNDDKYINND